MGKGWKILFGVAAFLLFLYQILFGSWAKVNALDFSVDEVDHCVILDGGVFFDDTTVTEQEDLELLLKAVNESKRSGFSIWPSAGNFPFYLRFYMRDGTTESFECFRGIDVRLELNREKKTSILTQEGFFKFEGPLYFVCTELIVKYNPTQKNEELYQYIHYGS